MGEDGGALVRIGSQPPVTEGDLTLRVAKILAPKLHELGADVSFVRDSSVPTTALRPEKLRAAALQDLRERKIDLSEDLKFASARSKPMRNGFSTA